MDSPQLLSIPNPFPLESGQLRLLEPTAAPLKTIRRQLLDGTYDKPYIVDDGQMRSLHLGRGYVQSAMRIDAPDLLQLAYSQMMMGFLLFKRAPRRIVLLGLGGGSLAKFCYRALPQADITAVEIDPRVIALRQYFAIPEDDSRFRVLQADAAEFVARPGRPIDVLLVDAFDAHGVARSLIEQDFMARVHAALSPAGMAIINLAGATSRHVDLIAKVRQAFGRQTLLVAVKGRRTFVLFAFKEPGFEPDWRQLKARARELKAIHGLDFPQLVEKMMRASPGNFLRRLAAALGGPRSAI